jgi:hypothetical protein
MQRGKSRLPSSATGHVPATSARVELSGFRYFTRGRLDRYQGSERETQNTESHSAKKVSYVKGKKCVAPGQRLIEFAGEKVRLQREEAERTAENQRRASAAYVAPDADEIDNSGEESGLPWGSLSMRHVVAAGKAKEQSSRETSLSAAASRAGGSSR